jgi:hypothetical protein
MGGVRRIEPGDVVLIRTGWNQLAEAGVYEFVYVVTPQYARGAAAGNTPPVALGQPRRRSDRAGTVARSGGRTAAVLLGRRGERAWDRSGA